MCKMLIGVALLVLVIAFTLGAKVAFAEELAVSVPTKINSFELFWPMVAGRTVSDKLYPIKTLKETLRGVLIFGGVQKAEYEVFLATKRVLETEALINDGKYDLAVKTIARAMRHLEKVRSSLDTVGVEGGNTQEMGKKLANLDNFLGFLQEKGDDQVRKDLKDLHERVVSLLSRFK